MLASPEFAGLADRLVGTQHNLNKIILLCVLISFADPDPGSWAFLTSGSGTGNRNWFFPDPKSQTHIFESLMTIFWVKVL
jgi:hypothetical protein